MFIGRGFDSDGDGDNDFFVGQRLNKEQQQGLGCVILSAVAIAFFAALVSSAAQNEGITVSEWMWKQAAGVFGVGVAFFVCVAVLSAALKNRSDLALWLTLAVFCLFFGIKTWVVDRNARLASQEAAKAQAEKQAWDDKVGAMRDEILRKAAEKARSQPATP